MGGLAGVLVGSLILAYKDVAIAAGNPDAGRPIGNWLRVEGPTIAKYWRVLQSDGSVADAFVAYAAGGPQDSISARELLSREGVHFDSRGRRARVNVFGSRGGGAIM